MTPRPLAAMAFWGALSAAALGVGDLERGNRLYREGRYAEAVEAYREALADDPTAEAQYNLGTALLRLGRHEEAVVHLQRALGSAVDPEVRQPAHYNLGGRYLEAARREDVPDELRRQLLDLAVDQYRNALRLRPDDQDAKWNLELALRERDEIPPVPAGGGQDEQDDEESDRDSESEPQPSPSGGSQGDREQGAPAPGEMSREQAERILSAVEQDERDLYRDKLRAGGRERVLRNW